LILNGHLDKIISYIEDLDKEEITLEIKLTKIKTLTYLKKLKIAESLLNLLISDISMDKHIFDYLNVIHVLGWLRYYQGEYSEGYQLLNRTSQLLSTIDLHILDDYKLGIIIDFLIVYGKFNQLQGNYEETTKLYNKAIDYSSKIKDSNRIQFIIGLTGTTMFRQGIYDQALEKYNSAYLIACEINNLRCQRMWLNGIGTIYFQRGNISEAMIFQEKALEIALSINEQCGLFNCYLNLGDIYFRQGNMKKAIESYTTLSFDQIKNEDSIAVMCNRLVIATINLSDFSQAKHYLNTLEEISTNNNSAKIQQIYSYTHAFYLKTQPKYVDKARAEFIFREIVSSDNPVDYQYLTLSYLQLIELLLLQLNISENSSYQLDQSEKEILNDIKQISNRLLEISAEKKLNLYKIEVLIVLYHISLSELNFNVAYNYLQQAKDLSSILGIKQTILEIPKNNMENNESDLFSVKVIDKMALPYSFQTSINKIIHSLPRLSILIYLSNNGSSSFSTLQTELNLSPGNLNRHCDKLIDVGFIEKNKEDQTNSKTKPITMFQLTYKGKIEFRKYSEIIKHYL